MKHQRFSLPAALFFSLFILSVFSASAQDGATADLPAGEKLFKANCSSCHKVKGKLVGPGLYGAEERWASGAAHKGEDGKQQLYKWIKNSSGVIKDGNPYAIAIFNEFNKSAMNAFPQLADTDIDNILAYIKANGEGTYPAVAAVTPDASGTSSQPVNYPSQSSTLLYLLVGLMLVIAIILKRVNTVLNRLVMVKAGEPIPVPVPLYKNRTLITFLVLVFLTWGGYHVVVGAIDLGRQQGYAPVQPVKFSHKLHAGMNKINCQYCHSSASKGKHSNIPSANVCMNCHKGVSQGPNYGRKEIAKIYAAIGFNPNSTEFINNYEKLPKENMENIFRKWLEEDTEKKYTKADIEEVLAQVQKPIEWVRIHNLPDHVYFNHSQHVAVAGLECQKCHGPVEEMEVLAQFAPLSMGWCISCHRTTEVNFAQNDYYQIYKKYHDKLAGQKFTVEKIGGTECQKCHY
jgi:mono/diheme cytochrome c family protein